MMKKAALAILLLAFIGGCSRGITREQYIDVMATLGCKGLGEGLPDAEKVLKEKGVTIEQIDEFRKNSDAKEMINTSMEIASRVMACHGVGGSEPQKK
ncbi:MAG: hypothetical protein JXA24_01410 [Proteobacteria bacterium]|nr:hypothetical protein [Pseudomonadota bacterium]